MLYLAAACSTGGIVRVTPTMACNCGFEAAADFTFCPKCGQKLAAPAAGAPTPPVVRIRALTVELPPAEKESDRRPVTVLFADLSGFTALSERLDPEDVRALQTDLFRELSATIQRFDGFVEKYVGDAVMAVFGAPVAHDEDPERAVRTALSMCARVAVLNEQWAPRLQQPLALHIGINTGPVVAGHIGAEVNSAYAVTGDTVNVAARLQNAANAGQILVSHSTYRLTAHAFRFESVGAIALKGKAESVPAYRVEAALSLPRSARGLQEHGLATMLVGRDRELSAAFDRMLEGRTQLVRIVGEAGAGKSRLLSAFLDQLRATGRVAHVGVRSAACSSVGEGTYGVPASLLRDAYGITPTDSPDEARHKIVTALASMGADAQETGRIAAFLCYVLGVETDGSHARHLDPEHLKQQIFLVAQAVIERRLEHNPLLLIVEDLHWMDAASVELLHFFLDRLAARQFMLLVTHRPIAQIEELAAGPAVHTLVSLEPLSSDHSETLLGALFGSSTQCLPEELRVRIVEHAGGNPLFLEEMVRGLIAEGVLVETNGAWIYRPSSSEVHVPLTIHSLLLARIDRLPGRARQVIQEAAVIGPLFGRQLLGKIATDPGTLDKALDALLDSGLVAEKAPAAGSSDPLDDRQYRFCHGLFHEASYQNLLGRRRTELHTRIGEALEALCGGAPQRVEELQSLGHHFRLSSDKAKGARYLALAGDWARSIYANVDAIRHYESALQTLAACEACDFEHLPVHEHLSDVLAAIGQQQAALDHLAIAREGYARAGDPLAEARVLRKTAGVYWAGGQRAEAKRCVQAGLALLGEGADQIERAQLYQEMGQLEYRDGNNLSALAWTQRALAQVERIAAAGAVNSRIEREAIAGAMSTALNTQGVALARLDRREEAVEALERSMTIAQKEGLLQWECRALANLGVLYSSQSPQRAIDACEQGLDAAKRIGDLGLQSRLYTSLAVAYCELTNRCEERGVKAAATAIEIDRRVNQIDHLTVSLVVLAQIYQCHGDPKRALGYYAEAMTLAEHTGEPQLIFPCYDGLATLYLDLDDPDQAEHYMRKARETCDRAGLKPDALTVLPFLA